jgi:hypothetical protein
MVTIILCPYIAGYSDKMNTDFTIFLTVVFSADTLVVAFTLRSIPLLGMTTNRFICDLITILPIDLFTNWKLNETLLMIRFLRLYRLHYIIRLNPVLNNLYIKFSSKSSLVYLLVRLSIIAVSMFCFLHIQACLYMLYGKIANFYNLPHSLQGASGTVYTNALYGAIGNLLPITGYR